MKSGKWIGHRLGMLTIVSHEGVRQFEAGKASYYRFQCDCGNSFVAQKSNVLARNRLDCGCQKPAPAWTSPDGATLHPLYKTWSHMLDRCYNPKCKSFKDYGARGIAVCARWKTGYGGRTGFEVFVSDMGARPDGFTIERVQHNGNYEPGNCVWLAKGDQSKNRRTVRLIRIGGRVKTIPEWCEENGIPYWTGIRRIMRGWPPDEAVTTPVRAVNTRGVA